MGVWDAINYTGAIEILDKMGTIHVGVAISSAWGFTIDSLNPNGFHRFGLQAYTTEYNALFVNNGPGLPDALSAHRYASYLVRLIPEPTIDGILTFFDDSVADDSLTGYGHGNSANNRLNVLRKKLQMASDLIDIGDIDGACVHLKVASRKCDGVTPPPDFVQGDSVSELYVMITELMAELGCE